REESGTVGKEDLHLRDSARVDEDLAGRGVTRVVLVVDAETLLAHRHPGRLAAPADVDELASQGKEPPYRGGRLRRRLLLETRPEGERARGDPEHPHRGRTIPAAHGGPFHPRAGHGDRPSGRRRRRRPRTWGERGRTRHDRRGRPHLRARARPRRARPW